MKNEKKEQNENNRNTYFDLCIFNLRYEGKMRMTIFVIRILYSWAKPTKMVNFFLFAKGEVYDEKCVTNSTNKIGN